MCFQAFFLQKKYIYIYELTKVGSDQRSSTIQYDSKSKHSKRRQTVNWTWEVACWFSFSLFLKISAVTYTTACARTVLFLKGISVRFFRWEVVRHARACSRCACLPARARGRPRRLGCSRTLGGSAAKWTNVVWPIKSRQTNQQTNKHTLLFYRYRYSAVWPCTMPTQ